MKSEACRRHDSLVRSCSPVDSFSNRLKTLVAAADHMLAM